MNYLAAIYAAVPGIAWAVLGYALLDDALDLGLYAKAHGLKSVLDITNVMGILANDYGTKAALTVAGGAFMAALTATGSVRQAGFYALAAGAAAELPNLKADVVAKVKALLARPAKPAPAPPAAAAA
jgi:hypothetical protein